MVAGHDFLCVGAGFSGAVFARAVADAGKRVLVIEKSEHLAGHAHDGFDEHGVLVHRYGPHVFHTDDHDIYEFLGRFTEWIPYQHRVRARVGDQLVPIPINRTTINMLYGLDLNEDQVQTFYERRREIRRVSSCEDEFLNAVGRELYELFFRGYTRKAWGIDPSQLDAQIAKRIPLRNGTDDRYFANRYQAMPKHGYTKMFETMLEHPGIDIELGQPYRSSDLNRARSVVFTGPVDQLFGYIHGRLRYRTIDFERFHEPGRGLRQPVAVINYPDPSVPYTRVSEFRHMTGQEHRGSSFAREHPRDAESGDELFYPLPTAQSRAGYRRYAQLAASMPGVVLLGRLAQYRYSDMDQVAKAALDKAHELLGMDVRGPASESNTVA